MTSYSSISFSKSWKAWNSYIGPIANMDLAEIAAVTPAAVSGWLKGNRSPRKASLLRIAQSIHELVENGEITVEAHNRNQRSVIRTHYKHEGTIPSQEEILRSLTGISLVSDVLGLSPSLSDGNNEYREEWVNNYSLLSYKAKISYLAASIVVILLINILVFQVSSSKKEETLSMSNENGDFMITISSN